MTTPKRQAIDAIDQTQAELIFDTHTAEVADLTFIVNNAGYCYDYDGIEYLSRKASLLLKVCEAIKLAYNRADFDSIANELNNERRLRLKQDTRDFLKKLKSDRRPARCRTQIYLMQNTRTGDYKIGRSANPVYREKTLQSQEPSVKLLLVFPGTSADERSLHTLFADRQLRGEWFALTAADLDRFIAFFQPAQTDVLP